MDSLSEVTPTEPIASSRPQMTSGPIYFTLDSSQTVHWMTGLRRKSTTFGDKNEIGSRL